ncbi:MAG: hypothetical protein ABIJ20_02375 [Nanoarchaeota archaeon]|nr:hypothetical protein [Nanoarchaeota archaeon]MBU1444812.1 hypothetical protein [Nanoarchaeota archaeon]MBU2420799.1 hypothetical protein [Nanoarchaeota archaeon]MBU2475614.1 hypothetical protein [Nanoarchaeota archaeon]
MGKILTRILLTAAALAVFAGSASAVDRIKGRYPTQEDYETPGRKYFYSDENPGMDFDITSIDCDDNGTVDVIFEWEYKNGAPVSFKEDLDADREPEKIYEFYFDISPETERPIDQAIIRDGIDDLTPHIETWDWNEKKVYFDYNGDGTPEEEYPVSGMGLWSSYLDGLSGLERRIVFYKLDHCD